MFWPPKDERLLLGRFYLSGVVSYAMSVILPFQFAYLYLVMEQPDWAVLPLLIASALALVAEIPTGILSDRWSRKYSMIGGYGLSAASWAAIPFAVSFEGPSQLIAVSICFSFDGLGEALVSGAEEAWAVDNVEHHGRRDLVDQFFARSYSFDSLGSLISGVFATLAIISMTIDARTLDLFWYVTAGGQIAALIIIASIPEHRAPAAPKTPDKAAQTTILANFRGIVRMRPLLLFSAVLIIASFADSITEDAFVISLLTKGLDARLLAPLGIVEDVIGLIVPLFAIALAHRMGLPRFLSTFLIVPALAACALFFYPALWVVIGLILILDTCAVLWDPVAEAHFQKLIPSAHRAALSSTINQLSSLAELAGLGVFALILGQNRQILQDATPDLVDAFSGQVQQISDVHSGVLGLSVPDLAIVVFVFAGLLALPFLAAMLRDPAPKLRKAKVPRRAGRKRPKRR